MPCYHPISAFRVPESGDIIFYDRGNGDPISLPCGRCVGCRLERSRQWAVRCMHEASLYPFNSFVTLTYDNDHLPEYGSLDYSHYQKFMKRLRKRFEPVNIRFYMCGEYGDETNRPHYHACLFNCFFSDRKRINYSGDNPLYTSEILSDLWPFGLSSIGDVTFESAAYVARYVMKKVNGDLAESHYNYVDVLTGEIFKRTPEFNKMSLKPGIGADWIAKYHKDTYPNDFVVSRETPAKPPRFYDKFLQKNFPDVLDDVKFSRYSRAILRREDNTPERLHDREEVAMAKLKTLPRNFE